jgi:hypothetical protein
MAFGLSHTPKGVVQLPIKYSFRVIYGQGRHQLFIFIQKRVSNEMVAARILGSIDTENLLL